MRTRESTHRRTTRRYRYQGYCAASANVVPERRLFGIRRWCAPAHGHDSSCLRRDPRPATTSCSQFTCVSGVLVPSSVSRAWVVGAISPRHRRRARAGDANLRAMWRPFSMRTAPRHRPGEVGGFSLLSFTDARPRAAAIAASHRPARMPPWKAERHRWRCAHRCAAARRS